MAFATDLWAKPSKEWRSCELWQGHVEPMEFMWKVNSTPQKIKFKKDGLAEWRLPVTMDEIFSILSQKSVSNSIARINN